VPSQAAGTVRLLPGKEEALRLGRPWVYRGEIAQVEGEPGSGDVVAVEDARGRFVAWAFYHRTSLLAARLLSRRAEEQVDDAFFARRLEAAVAYRRRVLGDVDACRLVFAEADGLPGLVVDRYGPVLVLQVLTVGMERRLDLVCDQLTALTGLRDLFSRDDGRVRLLEGLPTRVGPLRGAPPERVRIREATVSLEVPLRTGQKTGHFLDQRENRILFGELLERLVLPEARRPLQVLDAFCHTGGFGLQALARGADEVWFVDSQAAALAGVTDNLALNGFTGGQTVEANAFDLLRALEREGRRFHAVVLDPPAFAHSPRQLAGAYRGYKELNLRAMRLLQPGGLLCTSSCSQVVRPDMFDEVLRDAAADVGRRFRVVARRGAPPDHPGLLGADETHYLKCVFLQALD
jgi:23S rRNA (cytosine1962-C5)-methyltransferase